MKLYWGSHTCAIGTHVLLEEIGKPYETEKIDVSGGATKEDWFKTINPKSKVPALVLDDGRVLTEFGPIQRGAGIVGMDVLIPAPFGVRRRGRSSGVQDPACG